MERISPMAGRLELGDLETKPLCASMISSSIITPRVECAPPGPQSPVWEHLHIPSHGAQRPWMRRTPFCHTLCYCSALTHYQYNNFLSPTRSCTKKHTMNLIQGFYRRFCSEGHVLLMLRTEQTAGNFLSKAALVPNSLSNPVLTVAKGESVFAWHHEATALGGSGETCWNAARVSISSNGSRDLLK